MAKVLIGETVRLRVNCERGEKSDYQWVLNDSYHYLNWVGSGATAYIIPVSSYTGETIEFSWFCDGTFAVSVTFKLDGKPCKLNTSLAVVMPTVTFPEGWNPPPLGVVDWDGDDHTGVHLAPPAGGPAGATSGVNFRASVDIPAGLGASSTAGYWNWVQVITKYQELLRAGGNCVDYQDVGTVLDTNYPYGAAPPYPGGGNRYNVGATVGATGDTPNWPLAGTGYKVNFDFVMYIMFRPQYGKWVAIQSVGWHVDFCCTRPENGEWTLVTRNQSTGGWAKACNLPTWTHNIDPDGVNPPPIVQVNCPDPLCPPPPDPPP